MNQYLQLTIRQRLVIFISLSALVVFVLEGYFVYKYSVRFSEIEFRDRLKSRLAEADSLIEKGNEFKIGEVTGLRAENLPNEKIFYTTDTSHFIFPNEAVDISSLVNKAVLDSFNIFFTHVGNRDYGFKLDRSLHKVLVVSAIDRYGQSKMKNLKYALTIGILCAIVFLIFVNSFWIKKLLQPIFDKIKKAKRIGTQSLNLRLNVKNEYDELGQLALTFNEMLDRIEKGFNSQQQFIRNASHEMRTPLTAISGEADLALQRSRTTDQYESTLENIRKKAENLNDLINQLLFMAKVDTNFQLSNNLYCDANEILMNVLETIKIKYPASLQDMMLELADTDPENFTIMGDPAILKAAYYNLIENAVKYGGEQKINIRLYVLDKHVCLQVTDNGDGIEPNELKLLFEPFYRSKKHLNIQGSGIGLSLVKSIAEKHGGSVSIESQHQIGSTVELKMPIQSVF